MSRVVFSAYRVMLESRSAAADGVIESFSCSVQYDVFGPGPLVAPSSQV